MASLPVLEANAARIRPGMLMWEVRSILGSPRRIETRPDGAAVWRYGRAFQWNFHTVEFSKDGNVDLAEYDD